jgi:hypothetical protein
MDALQLTLLGGGQNLSVVLSVRPGQITAARLISDTGFRISQTTDGLNVTHEQLA